MKPLLHASCFSVAALLLCGCAVGPNYVRPTTDVPPSYKEAAEMKPAQPSDQLPKGAWWEVYNDPQLNSLEAKVDVTNQTLKAQEAVFLQARAAIQVARSQLYPNFTGGASYARVGQSENKPLHGFTTPGTYNDFLIPFDASYEVDVWGRVRRTVEAVRSEAQASAADLASVSLSLHAELAMDYFSLRGLDAEKQLLDSTVVSYQEALKLTQSRYTGGIASAVDVAQAQTQLETTAALDIDVGVNRAAFEHAIAVLVGQPPATFSLPPTPLAAPPPNVPAGMPSDLLERRPDIAAAERRMQEANANIGVARAAYFPAVTLSGEGGFESSRLGTLLQGPAGYWSLAGSAAELIFDGGQRHGLSEEAKQAYQQSIANYRQTVLSAFEDVEDNLAALRILEDEAQTQDAAVAAAQHSLSLSITRYKGGVADYLEVTTAQSLALSDEVTAVTIATRRITASVLLVKAIGGGWDVSQIPRV